LGVIALPTWNNSSTDAMISRLRRSIAGGRVTENCEVFGTAPQSPLDGSFVRLDDHGELTMRGRAVEHFFGVTGEKTNLVRSGLVPSKLGVGARARISNSE
jgi:hypothetical protein